MIFSLPKQIDSVSHLTIIFLNAFPLIWDSHYQVLYEEPDCEAVEEAEQHNLKTQEVQDYESDPKIQVIKE